MKYLWLIMPACLLFACDDDKDVEKTDEMEQKVIKVEYPETQRQEDVEDDYHGVKVGDPYRWLEYDTAANVEEWVDAQNAVITSYLTQIPFRDELKDRYGEIYDYTKVSSPYKVGDTYLYYKKTGLDNQYVIYKKEQIDGDEEVFIDPNKVNPEGTTTFNLLNASPDDRYITVSKSEAGSDWQTLLVYDLATNEPLSDSIQWAKFTGTPWDEDGFYYSRFPAPGEGGKFSGQNEFHSVYYHKLGTPQSEDKLIYRNEEEPKRYHMISITEDKKYLILTVSTGTDGFETWYKKTGSEGMFKPLYTGFEHKNRVIAHHNDYFYILTDVDAPNYKLIKAPVNDPAAKNWEEVIPERDYLLENVTTGGGKMFAHYLKDVTAHIEQYDMEGNREREIDMPGKGSVSGFSGRIEHDTLFYTYTSFIQPPTIYLYDVDNQTSEIFYETKLDFDAEGYEEKQVFYQSKDGTEIPMFIIHKKGIELNGENPTMLYGYGGFNINITPSFSTSRLLLLENGGIYAVANIRGGGEYGEEWHQQGMLENKQNVFDDFISAAEYLIDEGYTSSDKLAISGRSNGGLLVGAVMTQRPELFAVAFPGVGVLDMLRYHKFTIGWGWIPEYGSSDTAEHFEYLIKYSPLHNIKEGVEYPATLVTTADHDDRVVPAHSFKFISELQHKQTGDAPVLIRIDKEAGHGAGKPTEKIIEEEADLWAFFFYNTESKPKAYLD